MALPVNIEDLVHGNTVEWERLEFKKGWNPEDVIHCMCAFANDIHNWGGGYIIIGMAENKGQPVFPPVGIHQNQLDAIQGEIIRLGYQIQPNYFPIVQPYRLNDHHILVLWCPAGDNRPYTAPDTFLNGSLRMLYIRIGSRNIVAKGENLRQLHELTARIPFDDRINNQATIDDFDLGTILVSETVRESEKHVLSKMDEMKKIAENQKPEPLVRHYHVIDLKSSKVVIAIVSLSILLLASLFGNIRQFEVNSRMKDNDLKYRYIQSINGISGENIYKLEDVFHYHRDKKKIREIREKVLKGR